MIESVQIKDDIKDLTVKYLFIKQWKWTDQLDREHYKGAPEEGRVYRGVYNTKTNSYRLVINDNPVNGLLIPSLICREESQGFIYECVIIEKSNLLDLPIKDEDFDRIHNWVETNNEDLFKTVAMPENLPMIIMQGLAKHQQEMEEAERIAESMEMMADLDGINSVAFDLLLEIIPVIISKSLMRDENGLELSRHAGLGVNLTRTLDHLNKYSSPNRRTNENREDLIEAICHIMCELERREILDLDNE